VVAKLGAVTADDVMRVARRLFRREGVSAAVVGPGAGQEEMEALLAV
jgi:predicted Zn-dependent peptidase